MIPFDEIDRRLDEIGKDRAWLASESGRKPRSIGDALAPNAADSKRTKHLQKALTDAIEREEARRTAERSRPDIEPPPDIPRGHSAIYLTGDALTRAEKASRTGPWGSLSEFCLEAIALRAEEILDRDAGGDFQKTGTDDASS